MAARPKRKTGPRQGTRFMTDAVAKNVRDRRVLKGITQEDLASRMRELGHTAWAGPTVSQVERGRRSLSLDEFLGLALTLRAAIPELLDVRGVDGRQSEPVDLGHSEPLPAEVINQWAHGEVAIEANPDGGWNVEVLHPLEHDPERRDALARLGLRAAAFEALADQLGIDRAALERAFTGHDTDQEGQE